MRTLLGIVMLAQLGGPGSDDVAAVTAAEARIFEAIKRRDVVALESELASDFVHSPADGPDQDRAAFLRAIAGMPYRIVELHGDGLRVRVVDGVILVSGRQRARVVLEDGREVVGVSAFTDVFTETDAGWRLRHAVSVDVSEGPAEREPRP